MFNPRFTDLDAEIKKVCCAKDESEYDKYLIQPFGKYNRKLIEEEWPNVRRVLVTLAQKEMTQEVLIKKLCTYSCSNRTRQALFEFDKLIRSIYTLKYIMDPQLQKNVHRSQNRIEAYHQLRSGIAQVGGKKELSGKTDIEVEISNQCGRLVANAIIYYNSAILSKLLEFYQATNNEKGLAELCKYSPVAWQHIHLIGKYLFDTAQSGLDLADLLANLITDIAA
jgi:TnpA family transposase